jgi:hypothetical protein
VRTESLASFEASRLIPSVMSSDQVDGDLSQQGEIAAGGAVANPAVILSEGNVENPVQAVFDAPVLANGLGQHLRRVSATG